MQQCKIVIPIAVPYANYQSTMTPGLPTCVRKPLASGVTKACMANYCRCPIRLRQRRLPCPPVFPFHIWLAIICREFDSSPIAAFFRRRVCAWRSLVETVVRVRVRMLRLTWECTIQPTKYRSSATGKICFLPLVRKTRVCWCPIRCMAPTSFTWTAWKMRIGRNAVNRWHLVRMG